MRRAFTLIELLVALSILTVCFLLILPLMQYAFQYAKQVERANLAGVLAHAKLQELRAWAAQPQGAGYQFDDMSRFPGAAAPDPDHPEYTVEVLLANATLASPNTQFEGLQVPAERRLLTNSTCKVEVKVRWGAAAAADQLRLVSLVAAPTRRLRESNPLVLSGSVPALLPMDAPIVFQVAAFDSQDREIPDLFFSWGVSPITGTATIVNTTRDGRLATFKNISRLADGSPLYSGGKCRAEVRACYRGEEKCGFSQEINLAN